LTQGGRHGVLLGSAGIGQWRRGWGGGAIRANGLYTGEGSPIRRRRIEFNKGLQLTTDSWAFLNSVAFWRRDFCDIALTVSAVCCS
jgi:hypothetical protein